MTTRGLKQLPRPLLGGYYLAVGAVLMVLGWRSHSWWSEVIALGLLVLATVVFVGRGDASAMVRGELDERRQRAVDHAFRIAFFVLAWWVAGVAVYADGHHAPTALWTAGNAVAVTAAFVDYALVVRRT